MQKSICTAGHVIIWTFVILHPGQFYGFLQQEEEVNLLLKALLWVPDEIYFSRYNSLTVYSIICTNKTGA